MASVTEEYKSLVLEDLNNYVGLNHSVKASIFERIFMRKSALNKLHPNPEDEFSIESIGPNYEIVGDYAKKFKDALLKGLKPFEEPLIVEKMSTGGYMLLNGHHRWMAAHRLGMKRVPIQIVNVTPLDEIFNTMKNSTREMCVSFDLDEILLTDGNQYPIEKKLIFPFNIVYKRTLRKNSPALIKELRELGFDVWVYTGSYYSSEYINGLMTLHNIKVDGIVNGLTGKRSNAKVKEAFTQKYKHSLHIDNKMLVCVDTVNKDYESVDIESDEAGWAAEVMKQLRQMDVIKNRQ